MERFHVIEDGAVILRGKKGLFRQAKIYRRGEDIFASYGGGYIKLGSNGNTTNPDVSWLDVEADGLTLRHGRPVVVQIAAVA